MSCTYQSDKCVLKIRDLDIKEQKLYFIIGKSGIGKSTLIEALGLMSNTINSPTNELYFYDNKQKVDLPKIWSESSDYISDFRNKNYSFIFQENNLMENFTAGENMAFAYMIGGKSFESAHKLLSPLMKEIDLPEDIFSKSIQNLSGGQRQRVSFLRALISDYKVMFCDEPTGNLDEANASILMTILKRKLNEHNSTGIIVSHDITLALKFADYIIVLEEIVDGDHSYGYCSSNSILTKKDELWYHADEDKINEPHHYIASKIAS